MSRNRHTKRPEPAEKESTQGRRALCAVQDENGRWSFVEIEDTPAAKPKPKPKPPAPSKALTEEVEQRGREGWRTEAIQAYLKISDERFRALEKAYPSFLKAATYCRVNDLRLKAMLKQRRRAQEVAEPAKPVINVIVRELKP